MRDDRSDASPLDGAAGTVSQAKTNSGANSENGKSGQTGSRCGTKGGSYITGGLRRNCFDLGRCFAAAGATTGTALAGSLGTVVGMIVTSKTFWKVVGGILMAIFLWMFIIANLIGIILTYLGFADADAFANEAQSEELANLKVR